MPDNTTVTKVGLFEFLESHLDYRVRLGALVAAFVLAIGGVVVLYNYVTDLRAEVKTVRQENATLAQEFKQIGNTAVTKNELQSVKDLQGQTQQAFGQDVWRYMQSQDARINSLITAVGTVNASVGVLQGKINSTDFGGKQSLDGSLKGFPLEETRPNAAPPLSNVNLFYNPAEKDPNLAFKGTTWSHYQEEFHPVIGSWEQNKTGGFKTTLKLSRTVSKPDPATGKMTVIGTEDIPIGDASTIYSPKAFGPSPFSIPRWTASFGVSKDSRNGYQPAATLDYRITNRYGAFGGIVNKSPVLGLSIRFGGATK